MSDPSKSRVTDKIVREMHINFIYLWKAVSHICTPSTFRHTWRATRLQFIRDG